MVCMREFREATKGGERRWFVLKERRVEGEKVGFIEGEREGGFY